jgi:hypothetical protein
MFLVEAYLKHEPAELIAAIAAAAAASANAASSSTTSAATTAATAAAATAAAATAASATAAAASAAVATVADTAKVGPCTLHSLSVALAIHHYRLLYFACSWTQQLNFMSCRRL